MCPAPKSARSLLRRSQPTGRPESRTTGRKPRSGSVVGDTGQLEGASGEKEPVNVKPVGAGREGSLEAAPPENVRGSGESGTPDQQAEKAAENARNECYSAVENGMDPHEAESTARQNHLFPPDEEDQPHLGESPISSQDPTDTGNDYSMAAKEEAVR